MQGMHFKVVQISDIHLLKEPEGALLGVKTNESFQAIVNMLAQEKKPADFIILSGDLAQDHSQEAYLQVAKMIAPLRVPVYYTVGNHDDPIVMERIYPRENVIKDKHFLLKDWQFILLDTHKPGAVYGSLDQTQLQYLEDCLSGYPNHRTILFFHHHPVSVGSAWLDNLGLKNADELWKRLKKHTNVQAIFFGHVHQEFHKTMNGISLYGAPSTCIQFKRNRDTFALENIPPGYRWIEFYDNGEIKTGVNRIKEYVGFFDANATGY